MKTNFTKLAAASFIALAFISTTARADAADDAKWIAQCVKDNKDEGATEAVVKKFCACMNDKMDDKEMKSISEWEKSHKKEMKECEKVSGWK
jgi:hypothetical protein